MAEQDHEVEAYHLKVMATIVSEFNAAAERHPSYASEFRAVAQGYADLADAPMDEAININDRITVNYGALINAAQNDPVLRREMNDLMHIGQRAFDEVCVSNPGLADKLLPCRSRK